jgi:hypothetical protein
MRGRRVVTATVGIGLAAGLLLAGLAAAVGGGADGPWTNSRAAGSAAQEVYTARIPHRGLLSLVAADFDVVEVEPLRGGVYEVQLVLTPRQLAAVHELGIRPRLWRNDSGLTSSQATAALFQDGPKVYRPYDGAGNIEAELRQVAAENPELVKLMVVGRSIQGREILALKVTENAPTTPDGERPAVLYSSLQHAREWIGLEVNRRLLHHFVDGYASSQEIREMLGTRELWFVVVANPDGYEWTFQPGQRQWRKNLRDNNGDGQIDADNDGVDPNRNFDAHWNFDNEGSNSAFAHAFYRGPNAASEPETQAMQGLLGRVDFAFQVNYHSAAELLLYAEGWQDRTPAVDDPVFRALSGTRANPAIPGFVPMLSSGLYITNGETCDYAYDVARTLCWTPELTQNRGEGSIFEFPDDEAQIQAEFEKNLPFALDVARSAVDPSVPSSHLGNSVEPLVPDAFEVAYGDPQAVAVNALRKLGDIRLMWSINGGPTRIAATAEWDGGERYGVYGSVHYHRLRGRVTGARPGDEVKVWFESEAAAGRERLASAPFTYTLAVDSGRPVLVVAAEDYTGSSPEYTKTDGPSYLEAYTTALDEAGLPADVYDIDARGRRAPSALGVLSHYRAVVWYTGDDQYPRPAGGANGTVDRYANDLHLAVRDYLNEGGKLFLTGKNAGLPYFAQYEYHPTGEAACDPSHAADGCENLVNDFLQYYLSAYSLLDNAGTAPDGRVHGAVGTDGLLAGLRLAFGSGSGAANQDHSMGLLHTSRTLPVETYPQFASQRGAYFDNPALVPHTGERYVYSDYVPRGYQRLTRTVDLAGSTTARLEFWASLVSANNRGFILVEARTAGQADWTTLPDTNGHTSQALPNNCPMLSSHPQLGHYLTQEGPPAQMSARCLPNGSTGAWHAATGNTGGWQQWSLDLSAYAGKQVELVISYVSNQTRLGFFLDDVSLTVDGRVDATGFEEDLGGWVVAGAPEGSAANPVEFRATTAEAVPVSAVVTTADTVYMGFGFEAIAGVAQRTEVMCRVMDHLLGGTLPCAHPDPRPNKLWLPLGWKPERR